MKNLIYITLFFIIINTFCIYNLKAQNNNVINAHNYLLNLNFDKASQTINSLPQNYYCQATWLKSYSIFLQYIVNNNKGCEKQVIDTLNQYIELIKNAKNNHKKNLYLANCYFYKALLLFNNNETLNAITAFSTGQSFINKYIDKNKTAQTIAQHELIKLTYSYFIKDILPFYSKQSLNHDKNKFIAICHNTARDTTIDQPVKTETILLAVILYQYIETNAQNVYQLSNNCFSHIEFTPPVAYIWAKTAYKAGQYNHQKLLLQKAVNGGFQKYLNLINLDFGNYYANNINDSAFYYLNYFIKKQTNGVNTSYANLKMAWLYYIKNNKILTDSLINQIILKKHERTDEEKQALYETNNIVNWTPELIKARLLSDGGQYKTAIDILLQCKPNVSNYTEPQKLEMAYRLARCYQFTHQNNNAILLYNMVINSGFDTQFYYPAYSAYYMAQIYFLQKNNTMSKHYATVCTQLNSPVYKNTIHQKARKIIDQINEQ